MNYAKPLGSLDLNEVVDIHLRRSDAWTDDFRIHSSLDTMESEMRHAICYENSKTFLPLMAGFSILDQLGTCYSHARLPRYPDNRASGIKKALYYFLGYSPNGPETKAFYGLRNAIMHEAALTTHTREGDHYWFRWEPSQANPIKVSTRPWDGAFGSLRPDTVTTINPKLLVDQLSGTLNELANMNRRGELQVELPKEEIILRHFLLLPR